MIDFALSNDILWLVLLAASFLGVVAAWSLFGRTGLYVWIAIAGVTANLQVSKTVEIFGLTATLGNIVYAGTFLATDILNEVYGKRVAGRGVWLGFYAIVIVTALMSIALLFEPAPSDEMHSALVQVFGVLPRIAVASLVAYVVSQQHDVWAYDFWRKRMPGPMWVRNNLSTAVSQLIDSVVFTLAAFVGVFPPGLLFEIVVTTYLIKLVVAIADTPMLYLCVRGIRPRAEPENTQRPVVM